MRRLAISLCALLLSIGVALGKPGSLAAAAPPPPCPVGDTFIFCDWFCPEDNSEYCLNQVGRPPNCRVEQPFCFDVGFPPGCDAWDRSDLHYQIWCPYTYIN